MIEKRIVFVFGAGISEPYKFPLGRGLAQHICDQLGPKTAVRKVFEGMGYDPKLIREFHDAFKKSGRQSVDMFLEKRTEFSPIGKAAIAYALIPYEIDNNLFTRHSENLYVYLFDRLCGNDETLADFIRNNLSVITYNYDRSFEHFIHTALMNNFKIDEKQAATYVSYLPIVHLHGQLGYLPWQDGKPEQTRRFSSDLDEPSIRAASECIKIIHEADNLDDREFFRAHQLLAKAQEIVFLGFGYHPTNLQRLRLDLLLPGTILRGTCYGLTTKEIAELRSDLKGRFRVQADIATASESGFEANCKLKALEYLREYVTLR